MALNRVARVGLTGLIGLVCAGVLVVFLGNIRFGRAGYPVTALFNYVDSLKTSAPVLYGGGVAIGQVDGLSIENGRVAVALEINKGVRLPLDSEISIHTAGILGEKYVQIAAGHLALGVLAPGAVVEGVDPGSLDRTLQKVEALSDYLEPLLKNPQVLGGVQHVLAGMDKAAVDLDSMVLENRGDLRASLTDLRVLTRDLRQSAGQIKPLVSEGNIKKVQAGVDGLDAAVVKINGILDHVDQKKGTLGVLVFDDQTGENLRELLSDLKRHPWKLLWKK